MESLFSYKAATGAVAGRLTAGSRIELSSSTPAVRAPCSASVEDPAQRTGMRAIPRVPPSSSTGQSSWYFSAFAQDFGLPPDTGMRPLVTSGRRSADGARDVMSSITTDGGWTSAPAPPAGLLLGQAE